MGTLRINSNLEIRGSKATKCLERAWRMIRRLEPCLPPVVIVIMATGRRGRMGHFSSCVWRVAKRNSGHEVAINPALFERHEDLLVTLLHEAAHALLFEWGLNGGCGSDGYYHREEFRNVCRKLGLEAGFSNNRYGWNKTRWPERGVPGQYQPVLRFLRREVPLGLR
jgi:hypothetical protein